MKHLRLYENKSIQSIINTIKEYNDFIFMMKPRVMEQYFDLASDEDYYPDYGNTPDNSIAPDELTITEVNFKKKIFTFTLDRFTEYGSGESYYIELTYEEVNDYLIKKEAEKYNL